MNKIIFRSVFFLLILMVLFLSASLTFADVYPQLNVSGYKKYEYSKFDVDPSQNYFLALSQIGGFYPSYSGGPWQERLKLAITGKLSEHLSVTYDLEQQPETPDRFDVKVKYDKSELTFGDINAVFSGNDFASTTKALNGVMLTSSDNWYDFTLVPSAKSKSQAQALTSQNGSNIRGPYSLGRGSIVENSEYIELNGKALQRGVDYTIDYFEGKITFTQILTTADQFKYSYEYTNVLDAFFPSLSKTDFFGIQNRFTIDPSKIGKPAPQPREITGEITEKFPRLSLTTAESETTTQKEEESRGKYKLKYTPISMFSEKVVFGGAELKKDEDYIFDYDAGELTLITAQMPSDNQPLLVSYKYAKVSDESESIHGIGSKGPYSLAGSGLVLNSEDVYVDGVPAVRGLDYYIDYDGGRILFNTNISETSLIKVNYKHKIVYLPPPEESKQAMTIGTTYLRESAQPSAGSPTASIVQSFTGQNIIDHANNIYLTYTPIVPSTEASFTVKINGVVATPEVDYAIPRTEVDPVTGYAKVTPQTKLAFLDDRNDLSDGYTTGTVKMLRAINAADEVDVLYTYDKPVVLQFNGTGNGSRGPYYIRNYRNIVPGSETLQVWLQGSSAITIYTRNSSFEPDAGANGYSINYYKDNPYIMFNNPLDTNKNFQIIFQYVPGATTIGSNIQHDVLGFDGSYKIGDAFSISSAVARSSTDKVVIADATVESFTGNNTRIYVLHSPDDLIENSETLYVNSRALNKDIDYYISYSKPGQINFYYITPTTADAITVNYKYQSSSGMAQGAGQQTGTAYKFAASTKLFNGVEMSGDMSQADSNFTPMGSTPIPLGSSYKNYALGYAPNDGFSLRTTYRETNDQISSYTGKYYHGYDQNTYANMRLGNFGAAGLSYRNYQTGDDLLPGANLHVRNSLLETWAGSYSSPHLASGIFAFDNSDDLRRTTTRNDMVEKQDPMRQQIDYLHTGNKLGITDRFNIAYDYQLSESTNIIQTYEASATSEIDSAHSLSRDTSYDFNLDLTFPRVQRWTARARIINHDGIDLISNSVASTNNQTYHMELVPISQLSTTIDNNRQETLSVVAGGVNPKTERTAANATYRPYNYASLSWDGAWDDNYFDTGAHSGGNSETKTVQYTPISTNIYKLDTRFIKCDQIALAPSGSQEVTTNTNSLAQNYNLSYYPFTNLSITPGFTQQDYYNANNDTVTPIYTKTQDQTTSADILYQPIPPLDLKADYNLKVTKNLLNNVNLHKSVVDLGTAYRITTWGTLTYNWENENNHGEVQAGSLLDLDLVKTTSTLALNINLPQSNSILTSVGLQLSYKNVNYVDNKSSANNFVASLMQFSGSLNF